MRNLKKFLILILCFHVLSVFCVAQLEQVSPKFEDKLNQVRYVASSLMWNRAFTDPTPLNGKLSDPKTQVFVSYIELCSPLHKISDNLTKQFEVLSKNISEHEVNKDALIANGAKGIIILFDERKKPILLVSLEGAAPISFSVPYIVDEFTYQSNTSFPALHISFSPLYELLEPFLSTSVDLLREREKWLK